MQALNIREYSQKPHQQYFKLIYSKKYDLTKWVVRATYEEQATLVHQLEVVFRQAENIIGSLVQGANVDFYGGDLGSNNYRHLFSGIIKLIRTDPQEEGDYYCNIVAYQAESVSSQVKTWNFAYPDIGPGTRPFVVEYLKKTYPHYNMSNFWDVLYEFKKSPTGPYLSDGQDKTWSMLDRLREPVQLTSEFLKGVTMPFVDIVKGIAEENGYSCAISDDPSKSTIIVDPIVDIYSPSLLRPDYQSDQSDWNYLVSLAEKCSCSVWLELHDSKKWLYFVDIEVLKNGVYYKRNSVTGASPQSNKYSFFFPKRSGDRTVGGIPTQFNAFDSQSQRDKEWFKTDNHIQIRNVSITEDIGLMNAVRPNQSRLFDNNLDPLNMFVNDTGLSTYKNTVLIKDSSGDVEIEGSKYRYADDSAVIGRDENDNIISVDGELISDNRDKYINVIVKTSWELNAYALTKLTDEQRSELETTIRTELYNGRTEETTEKIKTYYDEVTLPIDLSIRKSPFQFRGVRLTCTVDGNVNIRSQRWYPVNGILRYSSDQLNQEYFLRSLINTFDSEGNFETKLEFFV